MSITDGIHCLEGWQGQTYTKDNYNSKLSTFMTIKAEEEMEKYQTWVKKIKLIGQSCYFNTAWIPHKNSILWHTVKDPWGNRRSFLRFNTITSLLSPSRSAENPGFCKFHAITIDPVEEQKIATHSGILQFISNSLISNLWHANVPVIRRHARCWWGSLTLLII